MSVDERVAVYYVKDTGSSIDHNSIMRWDIKYENVGVV